MARYTRRTTPWPENRREALCEWLRANGVDPDSIPQDADLYLEPAPEGDPYTGRYLHYEAFHLNSDGRRHVDERGHGAARERRRTPLLVDPPDWWEPYRKPTRDQLLEVVDKLRKLVDAGSPASMDGWEWEAGYEDALRAVQSILDGNKA
jgi:hypothetical protein